MNLSYCLSEPSNQQNEDPEPTKTYTEPRQEKDEAVTSSNDVSALKQTDIINQIRTTHKKLKIKRCCRADTETTLKKTFLNNQGKRITSSAKENSLTKQAKEEKIGIINQLYLNSASFKIQGHINNYQASLLKQSQNYTKLTPKSRNRSISLSKKRVNNSNLNLNDIDKSSLKSQKKILVTIYNTRESSKSCDRLNHSSNKSIKNLQQLNKNHNIRPIPYPCTSNIVIDLFASQNHRVNNSKSKEKLQLSKEKSLSKKQHSNFNKILSIEKTNARNQQRIQRTIQKLLRYQIVSDNTQKTQLQGLIKGYILSGEPQCKWVLLTIDEVFKKIRNPVNSL